MTDIAEPRRDTASPDASASFDGASFDPARHGRDPLTELGWCIERFGLAGVESEVAEVARRAGLAGVSPVLVGVLADEREPEVARIRAFGLVALGLSRRLTAPV